MKIAIIQGAFYPVPTKRGGAIEKIWFALAQEFVRRGHEVTHYSRLCDGLPAEETIEGVKHVRVLGGDTPASRWLQKWRDLRYTLRVKRKLRKADVVVTHTFWSPFLISPLRHGPIWVHVQRYPQGQMKFYRRAARLQTVSRVIAEAIVREAPGAEARVSVIPNPFPPLAPLGKTPARDPNLVLFVGRIHPEKGIELLIQAAAIAVQTAPELRFRIVGPSELRFGGAGEAFQRKLDLLAAPLGNKIEFTGPIFNESELGACFSAASVFVYPSLAAQGEASPVAPLEALARGCPVITSDLACFDDTIGSGLFAHRFDHTAPDAAEQLARTIIAVTGDRKNWHEASQAALQRAAKFSLEAIADQYLSGFQGVHTSVA